MSGLMFVVYPNNFREGGVCHSHSWPSWLLMAVFFQAQFFYFFLYLANNKKWHTNKKKIFFLYQDRKLQKKHMKLINFQFCKQRISNYQKKFASQQKLMAVFFFSLTKKQMFFPKKMPPAISNFGGFFWQFFFFGPTMAQAYPRPPNFSP